MTLDEYQAASLRTASWAATKEESLAILGLGIVGEAGEVADYIKKVIGHGHAMEVDRLVKEIGDVLYYVSMIATLVGVELSVVAQVNIDKLKARYPVKFETELSINRAPDDT
jgi:NTP pyrophosphatase (non-canonical NTP hydrolase)